MARGRVTKNRGWAFGEGVLTLNFNEGTDVRSATELLVDFTEISEDEPLIQREGSDYYFERFILWFRFIYEPVTPVNDQPVVMLRLGTWPAATLPPAPAGAPPVMGADIYSRILQEEYYPIWAVQMPVWEGGALVTDSGEVGDNFALAIPQPMHKWDLSAKFGLKENGGLGLQVGAPGGEFGNDDIINVQYFFKALARRRRP